MGSGVETGANVEYFFRLLYDLLFGGVHGGSDLFVHAATWWAWITAIGYGLAVFGMGVIVYALVRLFELRHHEEEQLETVIPRPEKKSDSRWTHIQNLMTSQNQNDWRQAIIEADIMLDDLLSSRGFNGQGVGEKLKQADETTFATIRQAWDAHMVRNQVAHSGSSFELSDAEARRTIQRYEAVFTEFDAL